MRVIPILCVVAAMVTPDDAQAEAARCPHADENACAEWRLDQLEQELAEMLNRQSAWIEGMPANKREIARAALIEAQKQWNNYRDAECRRKFTWAFATAMTERGYLAHCRIDYTSLRLGQLQDEYRFLRR
jgi:uncharacterized protein YecT (DUF1311 family)